MRKTEISEKIICPECGVALRANVLACGWCGYPIKPRMREGTNSFIPVVRRMIGVILCIVAIVCFYQGFSKLNDSNYAFYLQHYEDCKAGYEDCMATAGSYSSGLFKSSYQSLAYRYQDLMDEDMEHIQSYRTQAAVLGGAGLALSIAGICLAFVRKRRKSMALMICPDCGCKMSDKAYACPNCGYANPVYRDADNKKAMPLLGIAAIILAVVAASVLFWRVTYSGTESVQVSSSSKYAYQTESSYSYQPKTGREGALAEAKSYLNSSAFSYSGLINQLEYSGFSKSEATYAADNCGADWKAQALRDAKAYLNSSAFSHSGLIGQLEYSGFTATEAKYGADYCGADWNEQAAKDAKSYLRVFPSFTKSELYDQLVYSGFTSTQATYGVNHCGKIW